MAKKNDAAKIESLKLREGGMKKADIIVKTGLSRATLTKLFHKQGLINNNLRLSHKNNEPLPESIENSELTVNTKVTELSENTESKESLFKDSLVTCSKNGSIEIEDGKNIRINAPPEAPEEKPKSEARINVGMGQAKPAPASRKPDVDAAENMLDNFFSRGTIEILAPIGLLVAGYLWKRKDKEQDNIQGEAW